MKLGNLKRCTIRESLREVKDKLGNSSVCVCKSPEEKRGGGKSGTNLYANSFKLKKFSI